MSALVSVLAGLAALSLYRGLTSSPSRGSSPMRTKLASLLAEAGWHRLSPATFAGAMALLGTVGGLTGAALTGAAAIAAPFGILCAVAPVGVARKRRRLRRRAFREAWPDAIASLISAIRAGMSLAEACDPLATRGPVHLRPGFTSFASSYRSSGSFPTALERLRTELSDPVADRVVVALQMASEVGGTDLVRVLRALGNFVREDLKTRKEIEARWSWTVTAARVASAAPWVVLVLMSTRPEAARAYNSSSGVTVIAFGAVATFVGYRLMLRAGRLPEQPRL